MENYLVLEVMMQGMSCFIDRYFLYFYEKKDLKYNIVLAATAEEEIQGIMELKRCCHNWARLILLLLVNQHKCKWLLRKRINGTGLYCTWKAGHAAREEGENAIYKAVKDIEWFQSYKFDKVSDSVGPVKMSVTVIETENKAHNVVPAQCRFVVDTRVNELYTFEEMLDIIKIKCAK